MHQTPNNRSRGTVQTNTLRNNLRTTLREFLGVTSAYFSKRTVAVVVAGFFFLEPLAVCAGTSPLSPMLCGLEPKGFSGGLHRQFQRLPV